MKKDIEKYIEDLRLASNNKSNKIFKQLMEQETPSHEILGISTKMYLVCFQAGMQTSLEEGELGQAKALMDAYEANFKLIQKLYNITLNEFADEEKNHEN